MWIVHTASAQMPSSCKGHYRKVYLAEVLYYDYNRGWRPPSISSKGVFRRRDYGAHSVGKTERCAYAKAVKHAEEMALRLNSARDEATINDIIGAGGSA